MNGRFSSESKLARKILRGLEWSPTLADSLNVRVWQSLNELDEVVGELWQQILRLPGLTTHTDAVIAVKFYIISWCTLSDMLVKFINVSLGLGIHKEDVKWKMVFRNEHVKKTKLPEILKSYSSKLKHSDYNKLRNDIVHRGVLGDEDLATIGHRYQSITLRKLFGENTDQELEELQESLQNYLSRKETEFSQHLSDTVSMLDEIVEYVSTIFDDIVGRYT